MENMIKKIILALATIATLSAFSVSAYVVEEPHTPSPTSVKTLLSSGTAPELKMPEVVRLKVNGSPISGIYPAVLNNDTTIVPLRAVMEALQCSVAWDDETQTVTITKDNTVIKFVINSDVMTVGSEKVKLGSPALLIGEITYVPIRAVSEALGATVGWERDDTSVGICTQGKSSVLAIGDFRATVGSTVDELIDKCGYPSYKCIGENGLYWYVYADFARSFMAVATDCGIVCGYYTTSELFYTSDSELFRTPNGLKFGMATPAGVTEYRKITGDGYTIDEFYDTTDNTLCGVYYMRNGYYNLCDESVSLAGQSRIGLDALNGIRYSKMMFPLVWDEYAAAACTDHSLYMSNIGSLTHDGEDGSSAIERYLRYNPDFGWRAWGENICAEAKNIGTALNGWLNSPYHRSIMLSDKTRCGIGMVHNPNGKYKYCAAMLLIK